MRNRFNASVMTVLFALVSMVSLGLPSNSYATDDCTAQEVNDTLDTYETGMKTKNSSILDDVLASDFLRTFINNTQSSPIANIMTKQDLLDWIDETQNSTYTVFSVENRVIEDRSERTLVFVYTDVYTEYGYPTVSTLNRDMYTLTKENNVCVIRSFSTEGIYNSYYN